MSRARRPIPGHRRTLSRSQQGERRRAFALIELLVVITLLALLLATLLPALAQSVAMAREFRCQVSLRSLGFDYSMFADETLHGDRGNDSQLSPRFRLETFQESQYGVDEFWRWGEGIDTYTIRDESVLDPMRCVSVRGPLTLRRGVPCERGAVSPPERISYTFNARLDRAPRGNSGRWGAVTLSPTSAQESMVPLAWDVDGAEAASRGASAIFSAPGLDDTSGPFADDALWFPGYRHGREANVLFLDQHVESSRDLVAEPSWRWGFVPN